MCILLFLHIHRILHVTLYELHSLIVQCNQSHMHFIPKNMINQL